MRNRVSFLVAVALFFALVTTPAWSRGATQPLAPAAGLHDEHDDHGHDHPEGIPHIDPIPLSAGEKLRLVATTSIIGDVLRTVAGEAAEVVTLIPLGQNPHSYAPTPGTLRSLERAHIVFVNGFDLEEHLLADVKAVARGYVVSVSAGIAAIGPDDGHDHGHDGDHDDAEAHDDDHDHAAGDPHVWTDPRNVITWVGNLVEVLSEADPANAARYEANGDAYITELERLDLEIRQRVIDIPRRDRKLVVDHDALAYFARAYGFETVGAIIASTSDTAEPSAQAVARLADLIRRENVRAVFIGLTASRGLQNLAAAVAREAGGGVRVVSILTHSLAPAGEPGDTYLGYMRYNVDRIIRGLTE